MSSALIRVVIPTYNRAHLIREAIASVTSQTFGDFEIVVADDGSTDDTVAVVGAIADARIKLLKLPHGGVSRARNAAINVQGEHRFVAFLDSDDLWKPQHLERALAAFAAYPHAGLYFSSAEVTRSEDTAARRKRLGRAADLANSPDENGYSLFMDRSRLIAFLGDEFSPATPSVVVRKDATDRVDWFRPDLSSVEDTEFWLSIASGAKPFIFDHELHVIIRRFGDNLSGNPDVFSENSVSGLRSMVAFRKVKLSLCENKKHARLALSRALYLLGQNYAERFVLHDARRAYVSALRWHLSYRSAKGALASLLPSGIHRKIRSALR